MQQTYKKNPASNFGWFMRRISKIMVWFGGLLFSLPKYFEILRNPSAHDVLHRHSDDETLIETRMLPDWVLEIIAALPGNCQVANAPLANCSIALDQIRLPGIPGSSPWKQGHEPRLQFCQCSDVHLCTNQNQQKKINSIETSTRTSVRQSLHKGPGMAIAVEVHT